MTDPQQELSWRVGGPQGSGVDTAATIFARACGLAGFHLFGRREYYSNIMGRHSYYDIRIAEEPLTCHRESIDLLAAFESETLVRHAVSLVSGGGLVYSLDDDDVPLDRITFLDERARTDLQARLEADDMPLSTAGVLEQARRQGVQTYGVPFHAITERLAEDLDVPQSIAERTRNTIAVAVCCALVDMPQEVLNEALAQQWPSRQKIIDMNVRAVELAYGHVADAFDTNGFAFQLTRKERQRNGALLVNGNQAVALGKVAAGLTFQTYYPISPATDENVYLEGHETFPTRNGDRGSVLVVQTEDELAAVTMAAGAALSGARSATATSGPGFSLMAEGLGWAGINEVPLVVTLYQRGGPSTGMPTRTEQGDLLFAVRAGHGEFPRIVLASGDLEEAFFDAAAAFNYAERYQTVVVHLLDKALASTTQTLPPFDVDAIRIERGERYDPDRDHPENGTFERFRVTDSGVSPRPVLGQPGGMHWLTGGEHTVLGRVTEDPVVREEQFEKRARKLDAAAAEIPLEEKLKVYGDPDAALTIVSWGSNKGGIVEALTRLAADGVSARLVQVRMLWPFPTAELEELLDGAGPLVVAESNFSGQFAQLMRSQTGRQPDHLVVKYNGRPMSGQALQKVFRSIADGGAEERIVLRNPHE